MAGRTGRRWRLVRARRDAVPPSLRRLSHSVRSKRPLPLASARTWWLIVLSVLLVGGLGWLVFGTPVLGVREVTVSGSTLVSPAEVRAVAAIVDGTPLARLDTAAIEARVAALPSVATVEVSRSWPNTVTIEIVERTPVAVVRVDAGYLVLDGSGVAFTTVADVPKGLVQVRITPPGEIGPSSPAVVAAVRVAGSLTPALRSRVRELVADSPTNIRLELSGGITVIWGDAERSDLKARVATALLNKATNHIDVTSPDVAAVS